MTIGEPKHSFPEWVTDIVVKNAKGFNDYPSNEGIPELKEAIVGWVQRRYGVSLDTQNNILALNGTRPVQCQYIILCVKRHSITPLDPTYNCFLKLWNTFVRGIIIKSFSIFNNNICNPLRK